MINKKNPKILYGGDYSPEQWPEASWDEDMRLFNLAGIDVATVNVFSWAVNQPNEDTYDFAWLDRVMDKLAKHGIHACLATGTAAHPAWMAKKYPEILTVDFEGRKRQYGMRHNACPNSPVYRLYARRMAQKLAERYRDHDALLLWHINNEYGCECYCENCARAFRTWLKERYGTLEQLNKAWNTTFWSHVFYDWDEIVPPNLLSEHWTPEKTAFPSMSLDYSRFNSDSVLACYLEEYEAIKEVMPEAIITTNFHGVGTYKPLDYIKWAQHMDVVSWDNYPAVDTPLSQIAFRHDLMRGMKDGLPYLIMEQTPSQQNWQPYNTLKRPGVMRLLSYQAIARGADGVLFFQLKRSRGGCEKLHGAVIDHVGHEHTRVFRECAVLGKELQALGDTLLDARVTSRVGILFDWENWWAVEYSSGPTEQLKYVEQVQRYYDAFFDRHIPVDMIHVDTDLSKYDIVVAPVLYMVKDGYADKLRSFVENGGWLISTFFSGIVDEHDLVTTAGYPDVLRDLLGIWVEELDALMPGAHNELIIESAELPQSGPYHCDLLCEVVHTESADALASFGTDFYQGMPAITRNRFGKGEAWYVATNPESRFLADFVAELCRRKGIEPLLSQHLPGVEVTRRHKDGHVFTFYLNHGEQTQQIDLGPSRVKDLLTGRLLDGTVALPPKEVFICTDAVEL